MMRQDSEREGVEGQAIEISERWSQHQLPWPAAHRQGQARKCGLVEEAGRPC